MIRVNLPHMDLAGLSEGWLFRHCGDLHWSALCAALATRSHELTDDRGARLYPVFVAIRARYGRLPCEVTENEEVDSAIEVAHFGRAFFRGLATVANERGAFTLEMITTFAARKRDWANDLHRRTPSQAFRYALRSLTTAPPLLLERQLIHRREAAHHVLAGYRIPLAPTSSASSVRYEPSPYADYNGVGLLYFAAYPVIVDTAERRLLHRLGMQPNGVDWALATSTVARDVFYYRNIDLGESLLVTLNSVSRVPGGFVMHSVISSEDDDAVVADVMTLKRDVSPRAAEPIEREHVAGESAGAIPQCCAARRRRAAAAAVAARQPGHD